MLCPICDKKFEATSPTAAVPFCSDRYRTIDLSRWLGERYSLPMLSDPEDEELPPEVVGDTAPQAGP